MPDGPTWSDSLTQTTAPFGCWYGRGTTYGEASVSTHAHTFEYRTMSVTFCTACFQRFPGARRKSPGACHATSDPLALRWPTRRHSLKVASPTNVPVPTAAIAMRPRRFVALPRSSQILSPTTMRFAHGCRTKSAAAGFSGGGVVSAMAA